MGKTFLQSITCQEFGSRVDVRDVRVVQRHAAEAGLPGLEVQDMWVPHTDALLHLHRKT